MSTLERWAMWMRAQSWSDRTIETRIDLIVRVGLQAGRAPEELTADDVLRFLAGPFQASSRKTYHVSLDAWFRWLQYAAIRADNPMFGLPKPRARNRPHQPISTDHIRRLLEARIHTRTRAMVLLGAYQGLRVSEIAKFRGTDIDHSQGTLSVLGKGDVFAVLPLHPLIATEAEKHGQGWWFPQWTTNRKSDVGGPILGASVGTVVGAAMRRNEIPGTAHSLRHWYASELLRRGVDLRVLQQLMRHATLNASERYLHVDDSQRRSALNLLTDPRLDRRAAA